MRTVCLVISLLISMISFGQKIESRLSAAYKAFEQDIQFKHALISLYVTDSRTGKVLFDKNSQIGLAPASCQKVITSAAAFVLLGKDYRYKTEFAFDGKREDSVLKRSLIIQASGDPTLGSWRWDSTKEEIIQQRLMAALNTGKLKTIKGDFIIDDRKWETQATPGGWTWEDMGNYYGAGARGLNWRENQYDLILKPGKNPGDPVSILETTPALLVPEIINELKTGIAGSGDNSIIYLPENGSIAYLRGTVPAGKETFKISGSMPNPGVVFMNRFKSLFCTGAVNYKTGVAMPVSAVSLFSHISPPLDSINYWFMQKSVNLFGEAFVKTIAFEKIGFGATDSGLNIIKDLWSKNGIERSALHIIDGSGLSPANRVTTHALVTVMQYARKQSWYSSFYNALPEQNGIKMKSGYIGGVRSYTGYIKSKTGATYTFSFIINNFDGNPGAVREKMWKLLDILK